MPKKLALLGTGLGLVVGAVIGGASTYYYLKPSQTILSTKVSTSPVGAVGEPISKHVVAAKDILHKGFPGPVSDILYRQAYVGSYNRSLRNPNWVAEHLTKAALDGNGDSPDRSKSTFKEDQSIPSPFRAHLQDYSGSGFDRGHLVPAADVQVSQEAVNETFLLSNISPQVAKAFNRGYWAYFEKFVRDLTKTFDDVYVVTGPLYLPHKGSDGRFYTTYEVIGNPPNTAVPTHFFKVILTYHKGQYAMSGFVLPNQKIGDPPLDSFLTPVDAIERSTGLVFFPELENKSALPCICSRTKCAVTSFKFAAKQLLE
ncbi:uncharacterized protein BJ171DRAFT_115704 [Polychytrium aggregatum]|uniref:uncharacterized protein n=1 Tax=Polychytrium aggregatum TaxID=110093 RepID=UPI0022FDB9A0|nr:uncharacterized protein BJ171DRAFT_115704 [Polychytrium aggregatum]KAI9209331.1 hypothetical protein BJ171DRAFT_115704 [Polychytrium aggregatum]